jgi:two-component system LytT family sensor kinase
MAASHSPSRQYWRFQLIFWGAYWVLNLIFSRSWGYSSLFYDLLFIPLSFVMLAVTHGYRWLYVQYGQHKTIAGICWHLLWLLPLSAAAIQILIALITRVYLLNFSAYNPAGPQLSTIGAFVGYIINTTFILMVWCLICLLRLEWARRIDAERDYWQNQLRLREVELQFLRSQINSHFLFNTLNNIRSLILEDAHAARQAVTDLATLLRGLMHSEARITVSLREELELVKGYLALEALQFEQRLSFELNIETRLQEAQVPPLLLQTLVENAIKHGIARRAAGGAIRISASALADDRWCLQVENPPAELPANRESNGIGLKNARSRLRAAFGELASLELAQTATVLARAEMPMGMTAA